MRYVSKNTVNRLPKYLHYLQDLKQNGLTRTSSSVIAEALGMTASQVRQDLSAFGNYGAQGYGYDIEKLIANICEIIGVYQPHSIAVVGVGCIGRALLEHMDFTSYNYRVCAAFDIDPNVIGTTINGVQVYSIDVIEEILQRHRVDICMLTVSKSAAKSVASKLNQLKVRGIWNFTNVNLGLDKTETVVENVDFLDSLLTLTYYLKKDI